LFDLNIVNLFVLFFSREEISSLLDVLN
jgi:hypothetical protein